MTFTPFNPSFVLRTNIEILARLPIDRMLEISARPSLRNLDPLISAYRWEQSVRLFPRMNGSSKAEFSGNLN